MSQVLGRRTFLGAIGAAGVAVALPVEPPATAAAAAAVGAVGAVLHPYEIEGAGVSVALASGPAGELLVHVARRFHYEVAALGLADAVADRAGTVLHLAAGRLPAGATGGLFPHQVAVVRDILADCAGQVRWGGDDRSAPCEGRFAVGPAPRRPELSRPGRMPDVYAPARRRAALRIAGRQGAVR